MKPITIELTKADKQLKKECMTPIWFICQNCKLCDIDDIQKISTGEK